MYAYNKVVCCYSDSAYKNIYEFGDLLFSYLLSNK